MCAGLDRLRPATSAEALAMQFLNDARDYVGAHPEDQQSFVDLRRPVRTAAARDEDDDAPSEPDSPRTIGEPDEEPPHCLQSAVGKSSGKALLKTRLPYDAGWRHLGLRSLQDQESHEARLLQTHGSDR